MCSAWLLAGQLPACTGRQVTRRPPVPGAADSLTAPCPLPPRCPLSPPTSHCGRKERVRAATLRTTSQAPSRSPVPVTSGGGRLSHRRGLGMAGHVLLPSQGTPLCWADLHEGRPSSAQDGSCVLTPSGAAEAPSRPGAVPRRKTSLSWVPVPTARARTSAGPCVPRWPFPQAVCVGRLLVGVKFPQGLPGRRVGAGSQTSPPSGGGRARGGDLP